MVPTDPSLEEMKAVVVDEKKRPPIPHRWETDEVYHNMQTSSPVHIHVGYITAWRINQKNKCSFMDCSNRTPTENGWYIPNSLSLSISSLINYNNCIEMYG